MKTCPDCNNSRSLNLHRTSSYAEVDRCVAALLRELYKKIPKAAAQPLKTLVMDLYAVHNIDAKRWLGHWRDPRQYRDKIPKRYNALKLSGEIIVSLIDRLLEQGLIEFRPGFRPAHMAGEQGRRLDEKYERGRLSRMRATPKLIALLHEHGVKPYMAELCDCEEVIILRAPKKTWKVKVKRRRKKEDGSYRDVQECVKREKRGQDIDYVDTPKTRRMRKALRLINERLSRHWIDLHILDWERVTLNEELKREKDAMPLEPTRVQLRRIFSNGDTSFSQGGRFYGAWWQEIPKKWRKHITIDGRPTREWDYSGQHMRMLYAKVGKPMPAGDPYALDGYSPNVRDFLKASFNTLINAGSEEAAIGAMMKEAGIKGRDKQRTWPEIPHKKQYMRDLLASFKAKHSAVCKFFHDGTGIQLQFLDSQIAEDVMLVMGDMGIPCLPVHDSFLVPSEQFETLEAVMLAAWETHLPGTTIALKRTCSGWDEQLKRLEQWRKEQRRWLTDDAKYYAELRRKLAELHYEESEFYSEYNYRGKQWAEAAKIRQQEVAAKVRRPIKSHCSGRLDAYIAAGMTRADAMAANPACAKPVKATRSAATSSPMIESSNQQ